MAEGDSPAEELRQRVREVAEQQANAPSRSSQARSDSAQRTHHEHAAGLAEVQLDAALCALIDASEHYPAHPAMQRQWRTNAYAWARASWRAHFDTHGVPPLWSYAQLVTAAERLARAEARFVWQRQRELQRQQRAQAQDQARRGREQAAQADKQKREQAGLAQQYARLAKDLGPGWSAEMLWAIYPQNWIAAQEFVTQEKAKQKAEHAQAQAELDALNAGRAAKVFAFALAGVGGLALGFKLGPEREVEYDRRVVRNGKFVSEPAVRKEPGFNWLAAGGGALGLFLLGRVVAPLFLENRSALEAGLRAGKLLT